VNGESSGEHLQERLTMKRVPALGFAMAIALVLTMAWASRAPVAAQERPAQPLQKWEYKQINVPAAGVSQMEARLNQLGSDGWELCATAAPVGRATDVFTVSIIFKRPKR
jgi:hypothetical protein